VAYQLKAVSLMPSQSRMLIVNVSFQWKVMSRHTRSNSAIIRDLERPWGLFLVL